MYKCIAVVLMGMWLAACASSGSYYEVAQGNPSATVIIDNNITASSTWNSSKSRNLIDGLFKLVDTFNSVASEKGAEIFSVDGVALKEGAKRVAVEAGLRNLMLEAMVSGSYSRGSLSYVFEPNHDYQVRVQVADTARLDADNHKLQYLAELRDLSNLGVVLKSVTF